MKTKTKRSSSYCFLMHMLLTVITSASFQTMIAGNYETVVHNASSSSFTYSDEEGFVYETYYIDGIWKTAITKIPDTEIVRLPQTTEYKGVTYKVTNLSAECGSNVRDVYFTDSIATGVYGDRIWNATGVAAHVPDSLFQYYLYRLNVKSVLSDNYKALNKSFYTYNVDADNDRSMHYDINGDGKLELYNVKLETWDSYSSITATTLEGDTVYNVRKDVDINKYDETYGILSQLDCSGNPYWVDCSGFVYNSSGDFMRNATISNGTSVTAADINGDGLKEIPYGSLPSQGYADILRMNGDGSFVNDKIFITSDTTELAVVNDYTPNSGNITKTTGDGANIYGLGHGMFVKSQLNDNGWDTWDEADEDAPMSANGEKTATRKHVVKDGNQLRIVSLPTGALSASDYNGDGLVDLNDGTNIYYNLGGGRFFRSPHTGTVYATDLTGNGLLDYIDFTSTKTDLYITQADGSMGEPKTLLKNQAVKNVFFGDFDNDGDVDILFFITTNNYTLFQFYRNDGNGTFRAKDNNVDGVYIAKACNDYDGDGLYEVLAYSSTAGTYHLFKIGKTWNISTLDLPNVTKGNLRTVEDIDNDGIIEFLSQRGYYSVFDKAPGAVKNTSPEKMTKPSAVAYPDANKLKISWMRGNDKETSSCDLTYELRIGTASGKGDVYYGNANADGSRRVTADGNMGHALSYMYDTGNMPEGRYYIAVQAVDAGCRGGAWSDELVYDHKVTAPVIRKIAGGCTSDTLTLAVQNPTSAAVYEWQLDNGRIISQNDNGSVAYAQFTKAGTRTFSVSMTLGNTTLKSENETVSVIPAKQVNLPSSEKKDLYGYRGIDLNQDGNVEALYSERVFYENNSDGIYSSIRKTWNTDLRGLMGFGDFNYDGYPDLLTEDKVLYNSGENDFSFDEEELTSTDIGYIGMKDDCWVDWNNNGKYKYEYFHTNSYIGGSYNYYDFNRDGSMDTYGYKKGQTLVELKTPGADLAFEDAKVYYQNGVMTGFADFNNDGYADGYFFEDGYMVIVKGKPIEQWPCTETVAIPISTHYDYKNYKILDVDNNGYLDIVDIWNGVLLLMDKDFKCTKVLAPNESQVSNYYDEYHWRPLTRGAYPNGFASAIANEAPMTPGNVTAQNTASGLLLKWDDANDDHTPWAQMRYNVSLKIKGKTGAGAFVLSPMNGLSDDAAIMPNVYYRKATQLTVPVSALVEGTTYEVQVQAIDLMGEHSAMSKPIDIVFHSDNYIAAEQTNLFTGITANLSYVGTHSSQVACDPGENGSIESQDPAKGTFAVKWSKPGLKTVTMTVDGKTVTATYSVSQMPSLKLDLPKQVMLNTELTVKVPDAFLHPALSNAAFRDKLGNVPDYCAISYTPGDSTATIIFTRLGTGYVFASVAVPGISQRIDDTSLTTVVDQTMPEARIKSVESDGQYYRVNWDTDVPTMVTQVEIARETNIYGQYEVQDVVPVADATWCDLASDNRIQPRRYRIRLIASNDVQRSGWSIAHNPLHIDINKTSDGKGNNIMWNAYEGLNVDNYVILRGSDADKLKTIATVPASQLSYADMSAPEGTCFYAVRFNEVQAVAKDGKLYAQQLEDKVQSNVVSSDNAMPTVAATCISVGTVEKVAALSNQQPQLHLAAVILPAYATFNKVGWTIVSGSEYATLASNGVLTATGGKGNVVVRATTLDGSALSAEITIPCDYTVQATAISIYCPKRTLGKGESTQLKALMVPQSADASNVNWSSSDPSIATVDEAGVVKGVDVGSAIIWAKANDGSELKAWAHIEVIQSTGINSIMDNSNKDIEYYTVDGKKINKPVKGRIVVTNKGYKMLKK